MHFVRSRMAFQMWNYHAQHTDVWVFGTTSEYRKLAKIFDRYVAGHGVHTPLVAVKNSPGMDVLLLPTCRDAVRPFLLLQERMVYQAGRFNVELIIGGTAEGYALLRDSFSKLAMTGEGDLDEHEHISDDDELLVLPAVHLNIRGPVKRWSKAALGHYWDDFFCEKTPRLPPNTGYKSPENSRYKRLNYRDLYGRVPLRKKAGKNA